MGTSSDRRPDQHRPSTATTVKAMWRKARTGQRLKAFARQVAGGGGAGAKEAGDWLHNKRARVGKPPLGIGSTRKKKGSQGQPKRKG